MSGKPWVGGEDVGQGVWPGSVRIGRSKGDRGPDWAGLWLGAGPGREMGRRWKEPGFSPGAEAWECRKAREGMGREWGQRLGGADRGRL